MPLLCLVPSHKVFTINQLKDEPTPLFLALLQDEQISGEKSGTMSNVLIIREFTDPSHIFPKFGIGDSADGAAHLLNSRTFCRPMRRLPNAPRPIQTTAAKSSTS